MNEIVIKLLRERQLLKEAQIKEVIAIQKDTL